MPLESLEIREQMIRYNQLSKEIDDLYRSLAKHYGLSDTALWILYLLRESDRPLTQSLLCEKLSLRKQTIHSALQGLQSSGYVALHSLPGSGKHKQIHLTEAGVAFAKQTVDRVLEMELRAFQRFSDRDRARFLQLGETYAQLLQEEAKALLNSKDTAESIAPEGEGPCGY